MSYERLEFLGDSILGMVVARYLYERYPDRDEGFLSRIRTKIVNGKTLGFLGDAIGLAPFAILSKQIEDAQGRTNYKIMEDCFEAFIGAIYMDFQRDEDFIDKKQLPVHPNTGSGYYVAEQWIITIIEAHLDFAEMVASRTNFKDMLVRYMQHTFQDSPKFFEMSVNTIGGQKVFTYCVKDRATAVVGVGKGASKKEAENNAAYAALGHYGAPIG
jgi:ribonuclease-3